MLIRKINKNLIISLLKHIDLKKLEEQGTEIDKKNRRQKVVFIGYWRILTG
jgi:hypothetical protein